jgi:hypothetical protein
MRTPVLLARRLISPNTSLRSSGLRIPTVSVSREINLNSDSNRLYSSSSSFPRSTTSTPDVKQHASTRGRARGKSRSNSQSQGSQSQSQLQQTQRSAHGIRPSLIARNHHHPSVASSQSKAQLSQASSSTPTLTGKGRWKRSYRLRSTTEALLLKAGLKSASASSSSSLSATSGGTIISIELPNPYTSSSTPSYGRTTTMMIPKVTSPNSFQPVHCYPKSAAFHSAVTPSHMPLTLNLESNVYWPRIPAVQMPVPMDLAQLNQTPPLPQVQLQLPPPQTPLRSNDLHLRPNSSERAVMP